MGQDNREESVDGLFEQLDQIARKLEQEDVGLEESFQLYQEGMKLLKICGEKIDRVEKQLVILDENGDNNDE